MLAVWIVLALMLAAMVFMALTLAGALRAIDHLKQVDLVLRSNDLPEVGGLPIGSVAPTLEGGRLKGGHFTTQAFAGIRHLVVFAKPGCSPCERLVPAMISASVQGALPPTVVVSQAPPEEHPRSWQLADGSSRAQIVLETDHHLSRKFATYVTPHVFVIDEDGRVGAQGTADAVEDVRRLLAKAIESHRRRTSILPEEGARHE